MHVCMHVCSFQVGFLQNGRGIVLVGRGNCEEELSGGNCPGGNCPGGNVRSPRSAHQDSGLIISCDSIIISNPICCKIYSTGL